MTNFLSSLQPWIEVIAIAASPLVALQISERIQRHRDEENRKRWVLQTLMATRHSPFADDRLRALNSIDILFEQDVEVRERRRAYLASLSKSTNPDGTVPKELGDEWNERQWELVDAIARTLRLPLTKDDFIAGYAPRAVNDAQVQQLMGVELNKTMVMYFRAALGLPWNPSALITLPEPPAVRSPFATQPGSTPNSQTSSDVPATKPETSLGDPLRLGTASVDGASAKSAQGT